MKNIDFIGQQMNFVSTYNSYDHRFKEMIIKSQNPELFSEINIPRTTARNWMSHGIKEVVTPFEDDKIEAKLLKYQDLENKCKVLETKQNLLEEMISVFEWKADWIRLPNSENKQTNTT